MKTNILSIIVALTVISTPANLVAQGNAQAGKFGSQASIKNSSDYSWSNPSPIKVMPFALNDNTRLTIISPTKWQSTANLLKKSLRKSYSEFTKIFGEIPSFKTNIKLMDDEEFYLATGAPRWTNAMYYKEQIIIPLASKGNI
ncbi:MAG: hypothetical protein KDD56_08995, partial [Bdellovibrionales bacterium]|nr:hypothetical protein [Bdellovibrionales bacterium]